MKKIFIALATMINLAYGQNIYATLNVKAEKSANLAFISSGIVNKINVDIGSIVKKNEVLATLNNDDIKAMLDSVKTTFKYAKKDLDRQEKIKNLIDEGRFDKVASSYEKANNAVAYQEALYAKTFLRAPFDGIIYDKSVEIGDAVSGMMLKTVFKIQSLHKRKLVLEFDQKYHNIVKVGQKFEYKIDGENKTYMGTIYKIYPYADFNNRKIKAEVHAKDFTVGLFGDGHIIIDNEK